jgi:hypothetical protein
MKNIVKFLSAVTMVSLLLLACKKQINEIKYLGGTPPVLTASSTAALVLLPANANNPAITFSWTNPEYQFSTGISSQDVTYTLQIDTVGSNFKDINETTISKDLSIALTVSELNKKLLALNVIPGGVSNIEVRIKSTLANGSVPLYSNVIKLTVTTYLDFAVIPPGTAPLYTDGKLYLVGSATAGGWNNPVPLPTQQFTKIDPTHYTITITLAGGQEYLLLPVNGDWGTKYGNSCGSNSCNAAAGDNFKMGGDNIKGPASGGTYTITVNFVSGKFTVN